MTLDLLGSVGLTGLLIAHGLYKVGETQVPNLDALAANAPVLKAKPRSASISQYGKPKQISKSRDPETGVWVRKTRLDPPRLAPNAGKGSTGLCRCFKRS